MALTQDELARLERLEDEQARGVPVKWDHPKTVRGVVVRDAETITYNDQNLGTEVTKQVVTLRTENGLEAIFSGPGRLDSALFRGERYKDDPNPAGPPRKGDLLIVNYKGERPSQSTGREFKDFDVYRSTPETPPTGGGEPDGDIPF
jgi:hypothetical protein